jgi:hypothetical protein
MSAEEMDGLLENVEDAQKAASELVEEALRRGTEDNVSVALLHWPDSASRMEPESPVLPSTTGTVPAGRKARSEPQGRILIRSPRDQPPSKTLGLTFKVFIIVVPLVIVMVFLIDWILSL